MTTTKSQIDAGERCIDQYVAQKQRGQKFRPAHIDEVQVRMNVAPGSAAPVHVEAAVLVDDPAEGRRELLGRPRIEGGFLHMYEILRDPIRMPQHPAAASPSRTRSSGFPFRSRG